MKIEKNLILRLEKLARLELSESERFGMISDLKNILDMVEKLKEVDTTGIAPLIYLNEDANQLREDEVKNELSNEEALKNAPDRDGEFFIVPKVIPRVKK